MGATATILAVGSALTTGLSAYAQSKGQKAEGAHQARVYEQNALLNEAQASDAVSRGDKEAKAHNTAVKKLIGSQRAAFGAQGLDLESGSALDVQADTAGMGAIDELTIRNNAWREAWGYKVKAQDYRSAAEFAKMSASNKSRNTILTAGMNIFGDAASSYYLYKGKATTSTAKADQ